MQSKGEKVRECLREGPTTSSEVSATTGLSIKNACARLRALEARGQASRIGRIGRAVLFQATPRLRARQEIPVDNRGKIADARGMGYPGGKSGPGVYHRIINLCPPHPVYCEPFLGGGAIMRLKRPAAYNIGVDLDAAVIREWRSRIGEAAGVGSQDDPGSVGANTDSAGGADRRSRIGCRTGETGDGRSIFNLVGAADLPTRPGAKAFPPTSAALGGSAVGVLADPRRRRSVDSPSGDLHHQTASAPVKASGGSPADWGPRFRFLRGDALTFLASYPFGPDDLIYCDPPYLMETRSSGPRYRHEFSDEQHTELLSTIVELPCRVMISGYWSELYAFRLDRWNSIHFEAMTRGGMATEWLWFNFAPPVALHDYRYLGETAHQRQDLKRQIASWSRKLAAMSPLKKRALLAAISSVGETDG